MLYKTLFSLDIDISRPEKNILCFNYRGIINQPHNVHKNRPHSKYPIYLTVSNNKICFYLHHCKKASNQHEFHHTNSPILSLSFNEGTEIRDNLTKNIKDAYSERIPITKPYVVKNNTGEMRGYSSLHQFRDSDDYHSSDDINTQKDTKETQNDSPNNQENPKQAEGDPKKVEAPVLKEISLKEILLDFIYTAEHTEVFQASPEFDSIYSQLTKNFLFRAIRNKAEYYHQREVANQYIKDKASPNVRLFQLDSLINAEKLWIDTITDLSAEKVFYSANKWMKSNKLELNAIFESTICKFHSSKANQASGEDSPTQVTKSTSLCSTQLLHHTNNQRKQLLQEKKKELQLLNLKKDVLENAEKLLEEKEETLEIELEKKRKLEKKQERSKESEPKPKELSLQIDDSKKNIEHLDKEIEKLSLAVAVIKLQQLEEKQKTYSQALKDNANTAMIWYLKKYQISGFFRIMTGAQGGKLSFIYFLTLIVYVIFISFYVAGWEKLCDIPYLGSVFDQIGIGKIESLSIIIASTSIILVYPILIWIWNIATQYTKLYHNSYYPRLLAAVITAWCTFSVDNAVFTNFFDKEPTWVNHKFPITLIGALVITLLFIVK